MAIAAFPTATRGLLPAALRSLQDHHPLLSVESHEREPAKAVPLLVRGAVDVVIVDKWFHGEPTPPPGVEMTHLLDDVADLALPAGHELTSSGAAVDLSDCAHEQWISWTAGEFGHDWLHGALVEHHPGLRLTHTAGEHQTILALVAAGLGMALMPRLGRGPVPEGVEIREVQPPITRRIFALWRTDTAQRPAIGAAIEALTAAARAG
ncbi:hypothetical protein GCM10009583_07200 [Ornithinicoccus hortensis]